MTMEERDAIIHRAQLTSEQQVNDYVALTGAKLARAAGLKLDMKTVIFLGVVVLNRLPKGPEAALIDHLIPVTPGSLIPTE